MDPLEIANQFLADGKRAGDRAQIATALMAAMVGANTASEIHGPTLMELGNYANLAVKGADLLLEELREGEEDE